MPEILTLEKSLNLLEKFGIPIPKGKLAKDEEEAARISKLIGYPVVLKIVSPDIIHKTDVGGIALDIKNEEELRNSFREMLKNVRKKVPNAKINGILVQRSVKEGQQVIIGGKKDPQFGQTILFGLGGIFVEVFDDVSLRTVPIMGEDAKEMVQEVKAFKILNGYRGKKYDINSLVEILLKTSKLLSVNKKISELDINPVIVFEKGAFAVDARIIMD